MCCTKDIVSLTMALRELADILQRLSVDSEDVELLEQITPGFKEKYTIVHDWFNNSEKPNQTNIDASESEDKKLFKKLFIAHDWYDDSEEQNQTNIDASESEDKKLFTEAETETEAKTEAETGTSKEKTIIAKYKTDRRVSTTYQTQVSRNMDGTVNPVTGLVRHIPRTSGPYYEISDEIILSLKDYLKEHPNGSVWDISAFFRKAGIPAGAAVRCATLRTKEAQLSQLYGVVDKEYIAL